MSKWSLITELEESLRKDPVKEALNENASTEMRRIADHWINKGGKKMSADKLRDAIGNDLEMLEYSPEEVEKMIPKILSMVNQS